MILNDDPIEETGTLPPRLHGPGAVVMGTVLVVDVRDSSGLARRYRTVSWPGCTGRWPRS